MLPNCELCDDPASVCLACEVGFYLDGGQQCQLCSALRDGCIRCNSNSCLDCQANFYLDTTTPSAYFCEPCTDHLVGCDFCASQTVC